MEKEIWKGWDGFLTKDNVEDVAALIREMFEGKWYTWVAENEGFASPLSRVEVRTSQRFEGWRAKDKQAVHVHRDEDSAGIGVNDTFGHWSIYTDASNSDKRAVKEEKKTPYLIFDHTRLTIEHYVPAGHRLIWRIVLEKSPQSKLEDEAWEKEYGR